MQPGKRPTKPLEHHHVPSPAIKKSSAANSLLRKRLRPVPRLFRQGFPLRSNKRLTPPPLTARAPVCNEPAMKGICFFLSSTKPLEKWKRRNNNDEYATTCYLGRIAAQRSPHA